MLHNDHNFDPYETFSFTLDIVSPEETLLLVKRGDVTISDPVDADFVLSSKSHNTEEVDILNKFLDSVPAFKAASEEDGAVSVTLTLEQLNNYGFTMEETEELVGEDLDNDNEAGESEEHRELVDRESPVEELEISDSSIEDPLAIFDKESPESDYSDSSSAYVESILSKLKQKTQYSPIVSLYVSTDTSLEEGAQWGEILQKLIRLLRQQTTQMTPAEIQNFLSQYDKGTKSSLQEFSKFALSSGNFGFGISGNTPVIFYKTGNEPVDLNAKTLFFDALGLI